MNTLEQTLIESQNIYSSMARSIAAHMYDVRKEDIKDSLNGFQNIAHRLEEVATVRGIAFYNDSKATNVNATWYALETMNRPVIWIAGGQENGNDYSILRDIVRQKVKTLICIGTSNERIINCLQQDIGIIAEAPDMQTAVRAAYSIGQPGDAVLLSPACASFDRFDNYAHRGDLFKKAVYDL